MIDISDQVIVEWLKTQEIFPSTHAIAAAKRVLEEFEPKIKERLVDGLSISKLILERHTRENAR